MTNEAPLHRRINKRLLLGIFVLFVVDILWVVSAELSEYIFHDSDFDKPFFTTYLKTSMFVIYLFGFMLFKRWRYQVTHILERSEAFANTLKNITEYERNEHRINNNSPVVSTSLPSTNNMCGSDLPHSYSFPDVKFDSEYQTEVTESSIVVGTLEFVNMSEVEIEELKKLLTEICRKISLRYTVFLSLLFVVLWMCATFMYQEALSKTSAAVTNILSSTSGIFTLLLAAGFPSSPSDKFSLSKLVAVLVSFGGIFIVCWTDPSREDSSFNIGDMYALLGAIFYACYLVLVRKKVGDDGNLDIPLFLGFVGLFGLLLFWPVFFVLHYSNIEIFELPSHKMTWVYLILNGIIGTAISELLWLWGCFLTSSLMATLALGFVIPLTLVWDIMAKNLRFSNLFIVGTIPVIISFIVVSVLTHFGTWDPLLNLFNKCFCRRKCGHVTGELETDHDRSECGCSNEMNETQGT